MLNRSAISGITSKKGGFQVRPFYRLGKGSLSRVLSITRCNDLAQAVIFFGKLDNGAFLIGLSMSDKLVESYLK